MKNEIINLLQKEGKLSDEIDDNINIDEFSNIVQEIGKQETEHIKSSEILNNLKTDYTGKELYVYREVSSTNTVAKFLSMNGIENGSVIISETQTSGRGRSGKQWESPLGGVWLSIVLNPQPNQTELPLITLATGVAVAKTLEKMGIENPEIKWPNDVMINGKKVCGILTEAITHLNTIETVIIGVGINVNIDMEKFPRHLRNTTTTLKEELGEKCAEHTVITTFLEEFEKISELFNHEGYEKILKEWRKHSYSIGKNVEVRMPFKKSYNGYVVGINKQGALIIEKKDGTLKKVISGECIIKN